MPQVSSSILGNAGRSGWLRHGRYVQFLYPENSGTAPTFHPIHSTSPIINQAMMSVANRLLVAGIRVYLYPGMTHVKAMVVDGAWAYIGTGNLDPLSLRHNHELGLSISGSPVIGDLERQVFLEDMRPEWEMTQPLPLSFQDWLCEWVASLCL